MFATVVSPFFLTRFMFAAPLIALVLALSGISQPAHAQSMAYRQAVAEAASSDADIAAFYRTNNYQTLWTGQDKDRERRTALLRALSKADDHALPAARYDVDALLAKMQAARSDRDLGLLEVEMSRVFLQFARDIQTGILTPSSVDPLIVRKVPYRDRLSYLVSLEKSSPVGFFRSLPPDTTEYRALIKTKLQMEQLVAQGGWGQTVPADVLKPGASGAQVVALRDRLVRMGYMERSAGQVYDAQMEEAVRSFQKSHGLAEDGVAGPGTMAEINASAEARLKSVIVAMERERWMNRERGERHILVNLTDFTARIFDHGVETFSTRSVIGAKNTDRQSPEFSDVMEFMVVNPSWYVPRSIVTKEYLPALQADPNAVSHIEITDSRGRQINRAETDFSQFTERSFPFAMRQPPSRSNALGLVKFMFPNPYNIYLHDTPAKNLFGREVRAYSHGCIRLADPFDFAYALLAKQTNDPEGVFKKALATGKEVQVDLVNPVPVHLVYRTAFSTPKGQMHYRRDVYGRDGTIWDALSKAGVALRSVQG